MTAVPTSIPGVLDVTIVRGSRAIAGAALDLLVEIPHGATCTADYDALAARLVSPLPDGLVDFFHVNTDAGAPELGEAIARAVVAAEPTRTAAILRCRVPRTFIDCNRRIDAAPGDFRAGKVTPGLPPWITAPRDRALLLELHASYVDAVHAVRARLAPDGAMLLLHTYAPRTVDVEVDLDIVTNLRRAYAPEVEPTWPLRPAIDVIGRLPDGTQLAPADVVDALREHLATVGLSVADSATYPLHPSTQAYHHVVALPGRALCIEVRRDLLADPFEPFAEMRISRERTERLAAPVSAAIRRCYRRAP